MIRPVLACLMALSTARALAAVPADAWPEFRGPTQQGHAQASDLPVQWSQTKNVTWKTPIHGHGWSTPVIWGGQVWLTTATDDGKEMSALCLDRATGKVLFDRVLFKNGEPRPLGNSVNSYASPSAYIEAGRVFVHFGSYGTACLDTKTFKTLWERRDLECNHWRGPASSVVGYKNTVILTFDGADYQYVIALNKDTGETVWRTPRSTDYGDVGADGQPKAGGDFRKAFNTPVFTEVDGRTQMISPGAKAAFGYDPDTGKDIWTVRYNEHSTASRPVVGHGLVFINTGYGKPTLMAVRLAGAAGDVTKTHVVWTLDRDRGLPNRSSPVLVGDLLYLFGDGGDALCLEAKTGEKVWTQKLGRNVAASLLFADGKLYFPDMDGKTTVVAPGREPKVLATNELPEGCMASPVAVGHELYLRTRAALYRIEKK
jgi:outer membrane protein assembly factor BamB